MASKRIAGITIEIDGDSTGLNKSLKEVDAQLKQTQNNLKDVNKLLKLDPGNTELLTQKQKNLEKAIASTKDRLEKLKEAQKQVDEGTAEWDALQREIIATEQDLKSLEDEYREFGSVAAQQVKVAGEKLKDVGGKIEGVGQALAPFSAAAAGVGAALMGAGYKAVTTADDLNTLAKQTGLTTEDLQKMQYASDLIDVSFESMTGAVKKLKKSMTGHDKTWKALGVSVKDTDGNMRDVRDVFNDTVKALSKVENETERDQLAMDLFGKSADELAGIIDDGGAALGEYGDKASELGLVLDQDTLNALNETNDALDTMKAQLGGSVIRLGATIAQVLAPAIEKAAGAVEKFTVWLQNLSPAQAEFILKVTAVVAALAPLLIIGGKLVVFIGQILTFAPALTAAFAALNLSILPIVAAIAAVIAIGVLLYKNWDKIMAAGKKLKESLTKTWNNIKTNVGKTIETIKTNAAKKWDEIKTKVTNAVTDAKTAATEKFNEMKTNISNAVSNAKQTASEKFDEIKTNISNAIGDAKESIAEKMASIKENFSEKVSDMKEKAADRLGSIKEKFSETFKSIKSSVKDKMGDAYDSLNGKINSMIEKAKNGVSDLKKAFKFKWKLPKIKLPHFHVDGGEPPYGLGGKGSLPKFSIDWYRKAYANPMLFTSPTVLATQNGLKGFGDGNGAEMVYGHDQLMRDIAQASSGEITINIYAAQGMNVNQLADKVQARLVQLQKQKEAAYA